MSGFETVRETEQKLWVKTPFRVTQNVWAFFVKDIFPKFLIDKSKLIFQDYILRDAMSRWDNIKSRYVLREPNPDDTFKSCITDGEWFRWVHADLPEDKREHGYTFDWGLIYIPNKAQFKYLDIITENINKNSSEMNKQLSDINTRQGEKIKGLLLRLKEVLNEKPKNIDELRKNMIGFYGNYTWMMKNPNSIFDGTAKELVDTGNIPLTSRHPENTIEGQTEIDFYRRMDDFIVGSHLYECDNLLFSGIDYLMDASYRALNGKWIICDSLNFYEDPISKRLYHFEATGR